MIKKLSLSLILTIFTINLIGQTIVGTDPEHKKVILEEYTGIHCVYCPEGHAIAQSIQDSNPGEVFLVNIHVGGYATPSGSEPDFRTPFGTAIANEAGVAFYPSGSVNRHVFSGGSSAMDRGAWASRANQILNESSYVNVGVESTIDVSTGEIIVHVEAYYTGTSPESTNYLNIALLQNNTAGPQTGGGAGNNYIHMHRLVNMITGQWGTAINSTSTGSFYDQTFNYTIPSDYNGVPVVMQDLEIVAFVTESHQELISGNGSIPSFSNLPLDNDTNVKEVEDSNDQCGIDFGPTVRIQNNGNNVLNSVNFEYSITGGTPASFTWTGNLASYEEESVQLPGISYTLQSNNTVSVSIDNDDDNSNNEASNTFGESNITSSNYLTLLLNTDNHGEQTSWTITNLSGDVIESGGPYGNNETINIDIVLQDADCHEFRLNDTGGDGSNSVVLYDSNNSTIYSSPGNYGSGEAASFSADGILGINSNQFDKVSIYPNPANSELNVKNAKNAAIVVYDLLGRVMLSKSNISMEEKLNVSNLNNGTYLIKISNDSGTKTEKFIINR